MKHEFVKRNIVVPNLFGICGAFGGLKNRDHQIIGPGDIVGDWVWTHPSAFTRSSPLGHGNRQLVHGE